MTDYNTNDINVNLQFQNDHLNKTLIETRVLVNSLDNEVEKLKLENKRLKEQVYKLSILPSESSDMKLIKHIDTQTNSDKPESHSDKPESHSYFNIFSYFKK